MKQLIVISDSHGRNDVFDKLQQQYPQATAYLHCGDSECDQASLGPFISVQGNNDLYLDHPIERRLEIEGIKILIIHSHQYPIIQALERLKDKCHREAIDLCLYGHSHIFKVTRTDQCVLVNPGSIHYNRDGSEPSYAVINIDQKQIDVERHTMPHDKHKRSWF